MPSDNPLSVTELTNGIRYQLNTEFSQVSVIGELSGLTRAASGHCYFNLKDADSQINAIAWRSTVTRLAGKSVELENGQEFILTGSLDVYPPRGTYQLIVNNARPAGEGKLEKAFRQLHAKLEAEGLFAQARKRSIPRFPRHVVVITSPAGAAIRDFLQVIDRRWNHLQITIIPVKVQGQGAADEIAAALKCVSQFSCPPDVVVLTRGGGSIEDLWSFNEENVCRAIFDCTVPVISGVGHEIDITLSDLVADIRALTPSEAAERLVPDKREITAAIQQLRNRMRMILQARFEQADQLLQSVASRSVLRKPLDRIHQSSIDLDRIGQQLHSQFQQQLERHSFTVGKLAGRMDAINPLAVLARGYSVTTDMSGKPLTDANQVSAGTMIKTRLANGSLTSTV